LTTHIYTIPAKYFRRNAPSGIVAASQTQRVDLTSVLSELSRKLQQVKIFACSFHQNYAEPVTQLAGSAGR
jgi:hypothetical protein